MGSEHNKVFTGRRFGHEEITRPTAAPMQLILVVALFRTTLFLELAELTIDDH